jgi:RNA polymerase sigma-70 factor (ECF subfamily)
VSPQNPELARWFAEEVQPHEPALRSYLRAQFPRLRDIDDLVQDTYARLVRAWGMGRIVEARRYLFTTARNAALDQYRRDQIVAIDHIVEMDRLFVVEDRPGVAEHVSHDQEIALLTDAIRALPARCRQVLTLRKLHGLTHRAIADQLGISENTVSAQITLGVFRIRNYLRDHGVTRERLTEAQRQNH